MASYKKHILFSLFIALPFFPDIFYLSLVVIGILIIDLDHPIKEINLSLMEFFSLLLAGILYLFDLPFILGLILFTLVLIFLYISASQINALIFWNNNYNVFFKTVFVIGFYLLLQRFPWI